MTSARSFTLSGGGGGRSDISSLSSWRHRPHSDDDNAAGHEGKLTKGEEVLLPLSPCSGHLLILLL